MFGFWNRLGQWLTQRRLKQRRYENALYKIKSLSLHEIELNLGRTVTPLPPQSDYPYDLGSLHTNQLINIFSLIPGRIRYLGLHGACLNKKQPKELARVLSLIPIGVTKLELANNFLFDKKKLNDLNLILKAIPRTVQELSLKNNAVTSSPHWVIQSAWSKHDGALLATALSGISRDIKKLNLASNCLGELPDDELAQVWAKLSSSRITDLDLSNNAFGNFYQQFEQILYSLPKSIEYLNLSRNVLGLKDTTELVDALKALSPGVTSLNLRDNLFENKSTDELIAILGAIPTTVKSLWLGSDIFENRQLDELKKIFQSLPRKLDFLDVHLWPFSTHTLASWTPALTGALQEAFACMPRVKVFCLRGGHPLLDRADETLENMFRDIPSSILELNLSKGMFLSPKQAEDVLAGLPVSVRKLFFSTKHSGAYTGEAIKKIVAKLPPHVTSLDLSNNDFGVSLKQGHDDNVTGLRTILSGIPPHVLELKLSRNGLRAQNLQLAQALPLLSAGVTTLDLSENGLEWLVQSSLPSVFQALATSHVNTLILSKNRFGLVAPPSDTKEREQFIDELVKAFAALPQQITTLDLSDTGLGQLAQVEWMRVISAIPKHVTSINLEDNQLLVGKTRNEVDEILSNLPGGKEPRRPGETMRYRLANNGEPDCADFARALTPLLSMVRQGKGALPHDVVANILAFTVSSSPTAKTREHVEKLVDKIAPDEKTLLKNIQDAVALAVTKYHEWYQGKASHRGSNGFFTWFRHGPAGQRAADDLLVSVRQTETSTQAIEILSTFLDDRKTSYHRHSRACFLRDELKTVHGTPWACIEPDASTNRYQRDVIKNAVSYWVM